MNSPPPIISLDALTFDNRFVRELPADPESTNQRRQVIGACYSRVLPTKVARPQMVAYSREVARQLDLTAEVYESNEELAANRPDWARQRAGCSMLSCSS